jgi:perosamine synthetase
MNQLEQIVDFIRSRFPGQDFIPLHEPRFQGNEQKYVQECLQSTFVSSVGKFVDQFENTTAQFTGAKHAVATVNGTAALQVALRLAGVKSNDLVITQAVSFVATANAIGYLGAEPVFLDSDPQNLGLSANALAEFLENHAEIRDNGKAYDKTSGRCLAACVPMHVFGHPVDLDAQINICRQYNIPLVEDAAESLGSYYNGQHTGTGGLLGTLSFNGNKTVTTGGGGMILTNDDDLAQKAKHLTTTAKIPHPWDYVHDEMGYNYRLPNLNAALGVAQMEQLPRMLESKRALAREYQNFFSDLNIEFVSEPQGCQSNYWLNAVILKDRTERDEFLKYTNDHGVMTRPLWYLLSDLPMYKHCLNHGLVNARHLADTVVNIPSSARI